jgi:DNA-binding MarR family transcriptional regulator
VSSVTSSAPAITAALAGLADPAPHPAIDAARLPVRLGELAAAERIAPSTLTRLVSVLEERGYLVREAAPDDARAYLVTVTDAGLAALERIRAEATSLLTDILLTLPDEQVAALDAALPALERLAGSG